MVRLIKFTVLTSINCKFGHGSPKSRFQSCGKCKSIDGEIGSLLSKIQCRSRVEWTCRALDRTTMSVDQAGLKVIYSRFGESLILHLNLTENVLKNKFLTIVYSVVCEYLPSCSSPASLQNAAEP